MADNSSLTTEESRTLFDILTHRETYREIEDFKAPGKIARYGPPFQDDLKASQSPVLQSLLAKFILKLPGLRDVTPKFWQTQVEDIINDLAEADLSESYDKGALGIRKTLATAIAAFIEYPARGSLGGFPKQPVDASRQYDVSNPTDVLEAWRDAVQVAVYGDLIEREFDMMAKTDDLTQHISLIQAVHEFIIVNLASILHYTIVLSPEGPTLMRMIENVHKLIPYMMVRQTLKIGNVATMLSGMMRVFLAKVSMASVTNWMGLSSGADEGMNLMQQIISQVLGWDKRDLKKRADKLEKDADAPPKTVRDVLNKWVDQDKREKHEDCRKLSKQREISIVAAILEMSSAPTTLSEAQHTNALEYLALRLSIRDRTEIIRVMCKRNPDALTAAVKEAVDSYTPIIRQVHQAVNLADSFWDMEQFITDMVKMSKPTGPKGQETPPSVEDFVDLLHRHARNSHKFLHQVAKNGKELTTLFKDWTNMAVAQFRSDEKPPASQSVVSDDLSTGGIKKSMEAAFADLAASDREAIKAELAAHEKYIDDLHAASAARISAVIKRTRKTPFGPGAYLARWQQHMDVTPITPATAEGPIRYGSDKSVKEDSRKDVEGAGVSASLTEQAEEATDKLPVMPNSETTLKLLGERFGTVLAGGWSLRDE